MSKLTTLVAAAAIGIAAWNGYDAYTKRQELETTRQQLGTTTTVYLHAEQQLLTATEKLNKAQSQLDAMAAEEQKAETNLEVALTRGKNILNGVLPRGYQEGTVAVEGGDTPLGPVLGSFQGPLSAQVKDCSAGMRLFSDKKVTVQSLYAAVLTTQVVQNEPSVVVLAGTVKIPEEARKAFYEKMKNQPNSDADDVSYAFLAKNDSYVFVAAEQKNNSAVEQTASGLQRKYGLTVIASRKGSEKKKEMPKSEVKKESKTEAKEQKPKTLDSLLYITNETFEKDVLKAEKPVLVDFYADWCGPCREMAPIYEELSKEYVGKVTFAKLDIKNWDHPKVEEYNINGIPHFVLFSKGKEIGRVRGYQEKNELKKFIETIVKK